MNCIFLRKPAASLIRQFRENQVVDELTKEKNHGIVCYDIYSAGFAWEKGLCTGAGDF